MKKLIMLVMVVVVLTGCVSSGIRIGTDPLTGNTLMYGYSWTTGSKEIQPKYGVDHSLSATLIKDDIKNSYEIKLDLMLVEEISITNSLLSSSLDEISDKLDSRNRYTRKLNSFKIVSGDIEIKFENNGGTINTVSTMGSNMGTSSFTVKLYENDFKKLKEIYSKERIILVAKDENGETWMALISAKEGMVELLGGKDERI